MAGNQYRDYIKRSFFKYAISIISLLFVLMGLFLFINVQWISVRKQPEEQRPPGVHPGQRR